MNVHEGKLADYKRYDISGSECVVPLITAFRQMDQVMVVLPYFPHDDFRVLINIKIAMQNPFIDSFL